MVGSCHYRKCKVFSNPLFCTVVAMIVTITSLVATSPDPDVKIRSENIELMVQFFPF